MTSQQPQDANQQDFELAEPFSRIFVDRAEADWAFDLLREATRHLRVTNPYDPRVALTISTRSGRPFLHLNFGNWLVLGFQGPGHTSTRVDMALLADRVSWDERFTSFTFDRKEGEPEVRSYELPIDTIRPLTSHLRQAFEATLDFIADKFATWKRSPHWKQHNPEIIESLFDPEKRDQLFAAGLAESELRYERHLTAFHHEFAEEEGEYGEDVIVSDEDMLDQVEDDMNLELDELEEKLKAAFAEFRRDLRDRFGVKVRRKRAEQLRAFLSTPNEVDLETFNREVWVAQSATYWQGENVNLHSELLDLEQITEMEKSLEIGELELHGNYMWGSGSRVYAPQLKDDSERLENVRHALSILNDSNLAPLQKVQQIIKIYGFGYNIATGLVMVFHPTEFCIYNRQGREGLESLGYKLDNTIDAYERILLDLKDKLKADDFLELDAFLDAIYRGKYDVITMSSGQRELELDNESEIVSDIEVDDDEQLSTVNYPYPLSHLADDTGFDEETLRRWVRAIERKGQAILYGPPGTGKTFIAEGLAQHLIGGGDGFVELVQFHPAYAYEDFMQGLRPKSRAEGGLDYRMVSGRFLEFCQKAQRHNGRCVLIIDEINRANLARVFGELMYLLEYRNREVPLAGGDRFKIPENVRLIGTMNTADRSIALVDHALRRRFAFIALRPNYDVLHQYHQREETGFPINKLVKILTRLNQQIEDDYEVGITFFLRRNLVDELEDIWRMEIEPYLEEYFFDQRSTVNDFRWDEIRPEIFPE